MRPNWQKKATSNTIVPKIPADQLITVKDVFNTGERKWHNAWYKHYPDIVLVHQERFYIEGHKMPFRMDFNEPNTRVVVEISGGVHSIQSIRRRDMMRQRWLHDHGYLVYSFDTADMTLRDLPKHCKQVYDSIERRKGCGLYGCLAFWPI